MGVEPLPGLRISIGADLDVRAGRLMVYDIPALPTASAVGRILGRLILFLIDQIPFPCAVLLWESLPRLVPQLMRTHVADALAPPRRYYRESLVLPHAPCGRPRSPGVLA